MNNFETLITVYLTAVNIAAFALMGADKATATRKRRRVPEKTLIIIAFMAGGAGILLGCGAFRHKIRKQGLMAVFWTIFIAEIIAAAAVYSGGIF